jgi:hypothetical protein
MTSCRDYRRLMVLLALGLPWLPALIAPLHAQPPAKVIHQDFRGRKPLGADWKLVPVNKHEDFVKFEDEGLRITIPKTRLKNDPIGIRLTYPASGNFEITAAYEILAADKPPPKGGAVGIGFNLLPLSNYQKLAKLGQFLLAAGGNAFVAERSIKDAPDNQWKSVPASAMAGQLKLIREGAELRYLVAEPPANEFREILRADFTAEDLEIVRLGVNNNNSPAGVDVRITNLKIQFTQGAKGDAPAMPPDAADVTNSRGRLAVILMIGLGAIFLLALALLFVARMRKRSRSAATDEAAPSGLGFFCPLCGAKLKAQAGSAGKKMKCPKCGETVQVPRE